jgi:hypothetical protein
MFVNRKLEDILNVFSKYDVDKEEHMITNISSPTKLTELVF